MAKLKKEVVQQIRNDLTNTWDTQVQLAEKYGVTTHNFEEATREMLQRFVWKIIILSVSYHRNPDNKTQTLWYNLDGLSG